MMTSRLKWAYTQGLPDEYLVFLVLETVAPLFERPPLSRCFWIRTRSAVLNPALDVVIGLFNVGPATPCACAFAWLLFWPSGTFPVLRTNEHFETSPLSRSSACATVSLSDAACSLCCLSLRKLVPLRASTWTCPLMGLALAECSVPAAFWTCSGRICSVFEACLNASVTGTVIALL